MLAASSLQSYVLDYLSMLRYKISREKLFILCYSLVYSNVIYCMSVWEHVNKTSLIPVIVFHERIVSILGGLAAHRSGF